MCRARDAGFVSRRTPAASHPQLLRGRLQHRPQPGPPARRAEAVRHVRKHHRRIHLGPRRDARLTRTMEQVTAARRVGTGSHAHPFPGFYCPGPAAGAALQSHRSPTHAVRPGRHPHGHRVRGTGFLRGTEGRGDGCARLVVPGVALFRGDLGETMGRLQGRGARLRTRVPDLLSRHSYADPHLCATARGSVDAVRQRGGSVPVDQPGRERGHGTARAGPGAGRLARAYR